MVPVVVTCALQWVARRSLRALTGLAAVALAVATGLAAPTAAQSSTNMIIGPQPTSVGAAHTDDAADIDGVAQTEDAGAAAADPVTADTASSAYVAEPITDVRPAVADVPGADQVAAGRHVAALGQRAPPRR